MTLSSERFPITRIGFDNGLPLSVISFKALPFTVRRCYWLEIGFNQTRGIHAHKTLNQLLFCVFGEINLKLHDGESWNQLTITPQSPGLLISGVVWREINSVAPKSILFVLGDQDFDESDYIRSFDAFLSYTEKNKYL